MLAVAGDGLYAALPLPGAERLRERSVAGVHVTEAMHPPSAVLSVHSHRAETASILLAGSFDELANGARASVSEHVAIVRCAGCRHMDVIGARGARILHFDFGPFYLGDRDLEIPEWRPHRSPRVSVLAFALCGELRHADDTAALTREGLVDEIVGELLGHRQPETGTRPPTWVRRAAELLEDRYREHLTMAGIAREVGVHRVTLAREFRRWVGVPPGVYLRQIRLGRALRAMALDGFAPSDAAIRAGFYDQSHLTRWLQREAGTTPGRMRR